MGPKNAKRLSKLSLGSVSLGKNLSCRPLWIIFPTLWDLKGFSSFHHSPPECLPYGPQLALSYQKAYSDSRPVFSPRGRHSPELSPEPWGGIHAPPPERRDLSRLRVQHDAWPSWASARNSVDAFRLGAGCSTLTTAATGLMDHSG